ncbi:hypothetical protein ACFLYV_03210 [Chloroflexota bacterium]
MVYLVYVKKLNTACLKIKERYKWLPSLAMSVVAGLGIYFGFVVVTRIELFKGTIFGVILPPP